MTSFFTTSTFASLSRRTFAIVVFLYVSIGVIPTAFGGMIVNIDATKYGFAAPTDPAPVPGQLISPFGPGGALNHISLGAGTYTITNATGLAGATPTFTGWRFNSGNNWVWNFIISDAATNRVLMYKEAGGLKSSQSLIAAQSAVQNFSTSFTLATPKTLNFMIRDYNLSDNAGGVALNISPAATAVPEPSSIALLGFGAFACVAVRRFRSSRAMKTAKPVAAASASAADDDAFAKV